MTIIVTLELDTSGILQAKAEIQGTNITVGTRISYETTFKCTSAGYTGSEINTFENGITLY